MFFPYVQVVGQDYGLNCEVLESIDSILQIYDVNGRDSPSVPVPSELSNPDPLPNRKRLAAFIRKPASSFRPRRIDSQVRLFQSYVMQCAK